MKKMSMKTKILPVWKLVVYLIFSLGIYGIYWFYKNNKYLKEEFGENISPGLRTLVFMFIPFANIILFYKLLDEMGKHSEKMGVETYSPLLYTIIFYLFSFTIIAPIWIIISVQKTLNKTWKIKETQEKETCDTELYE